ncbi:hypothetical protein scyTo_0026447 [Scyliorhinus torazame]|uniref:Uncharacterized protein n=1 Tax=Scyliorhinus torazame TaxID=75743 RepID=A0A401QK30_SCYTO|nr:hypothetical protein [Scyliorhinus torazame]
MAAAAWTESKAHRKHLEKAVWLVCLSQQVAKTEHRIEELEQELGEVRASAGDSASAAERLWEELAEMKQGSLQESESNRCEKEYLHCQIVESKTKERRLQELYARSTEQYRKMEGKFRDIQAACRVAREEVGDCDHGPCQARITELEETLSKVRGQVHLVSPGGSQGAYSSQRMIPQRPSGIDRLLRRRDCVWVGRQGTGRPGRGGPKGEPRGIPR